MGPNVGLKFLVDQILVLVMLTQEVRSVCVCEIPLLIKSLILAVLCCSFVFLHSIADSSGLFTDISFNEF